MNKYKQPPALLTDLVLLRPIGIKTELYTTSDIIAEHTGHTSD